MEITKINNKVIVCGIYKITSPIGKIYVGQATDIYKRWLYYKYLKCKGQPKLYNSFIKYGVENHDFEIICTCEEEKLNEMEIIHIQNHNSFDRTIGLNLSSGGKSGGRMSEESKQKNRNSHMGIKTGPLSEQHKRNISNGCKGKKLTDGHRKNISKGLKGRTPWIKGKHHSEETKRKMSDATRGEKSNMFGKHLSEETKDKIRKKLKGIPRPQKIIDAQKATWDRKRKRGQIIFTQEHRRKLSIANTGRPVSKKVLKYFRKNWKKNKNNS